ncbi:hypothetical protein [Microbacterium oryzae]|uniref:Uncharacterized protein n=1 Tax=Microbacterium oryzae TaxID=743009 RepID=A0A6I6DPC0_9MICO|nr:hypothetical protein [Microbacterium oryzae]QGU26755.1 hypothetical protein D7D94_03040 [Microbacterium oryzae]
MKIKKRTSAVLGMGAAIAMSMFGAVAPASAATLAPSCVIAHTLSNGDVKVANNCAKAKRIKVVMAWGPDLACWTIGAGGAAIWDDPLGRLDRVVLC